VGEDIEEVHDMRVATRRMRSTLRLLEAYYKPKAIQPHLQYLRRIAGMLGAVRDLDVMSADLNAFQETLGVEKRADLESIFAHLNEELGTARKDLIRLLDKNSYRRFVGEFSDFLTTPGKGAVSVKEDEVHPYQVRHLLPTLIYDHLGAVRAYDHALADADLDTLHALRIEFKRLRYAVSVFSEVLGNSINDFIDELKKIQDHLGTINDLRTAEERLGELASDLDSQGETFAALQQYIEHMREKQQDLRGGVDEVWRRFNSKTVQRQLATAVASL
jgi:CHAD domain-containing protein